MIMERREKPAISFIHHIYGGLNMSWLTVILLAVGTAILTSIFLVVPVFQDTSFERMGVYFEAWFFFAIIIMSNCDKPLESALKTFVFFLISQPLIYLFQVPFSPMGWGLFMFYKNWFIWTLLTFPMAFIGWYITKKNWLSVLILSPVLVFMGITAYQCGTQCANHFPRLLITALFCLLQIILYVIAFFPDVIKKVVGILIPVITVAVFALGRPSVNVDGAVFLPNDRALTDSAVIIMDENPSMSISIDRTGEDSMIRIRATKLGECDFVIKDGDNEYRYTARVFEDDGGHTQIRVEER